MFRSHFCPACLIYVACDSFMLPCFVSSPATVYCSGTSSCHIYIFCFWFVLHVSARRSTRTYSRLHACMHSHCEDHDQHVNNLGCDMYSHILIVFTVKWRTPMGMKKFDAMIAGVHVNGDTPQRLAWFGTMRRVSSLLLE